MKNKLIVMLLMMIIIFFIGHRCAHVETNIIGNVSSCFLYPLLRLQHYSIEPVRAWYAKREVLATVEKKLAIVTRECDELRAELIALCGTQQYVQETRNLMPFNKRYASQKGVIAQILVRHLSDNAQFMFVDAGSRDGIKEDMVVIHNNCLVGRVEQIYPWYCKVRLITDAACKVAVYCVKTGACGIHQGANKEMTELKYVSHLERVRAGDLVLSNGEGLIFPAGFALGTIQSVEQGDLVHAIAVKPMIDLLSLRYCMVVSKEDMR